MANKLKDNDYFPYYRLPNMQNRNVSWADIRREMENPPEPSFYWEIQGEIAIFHTDK